MHGRTTYNKCIKYIKCQDLKHTKCVGGKGRLFRVWVNSDQAQRQHLHQLLSSSPVRRYPRASSQTNQVKVPGAHESLRFNGSTTDAHLCRECDLDLLLLDFERDRECFFLLSLSAAEPVDTPRYAFIHVLAKS